MRVLVTGTEGYLGCLLAPLLMAEGHDVVGLDTGYYKAGWLCPGPLAGSAGCRSPMRPRAPLPRGSARQCGIRAGFVLISARRHA